MDNDVMRAEFEAWAQDTGLDCERHSACADWYQEFQTALTWRAWKKGALAARQPVGQEPAFYLAKADAEFIASRNSNANQVIAILNPRSKSAVPFYTTPPAPAAVPVDRIQALRDAIEGECEGLAVSTATAAAILNHVGPSLTGERHVVAYMVDGSLEQGLFFDKQAAHAMAFANCGTVRPLVLATHPSRQRRRMVMRELSTERDS